MKVAATRQPLKNVKMVSWLLPHGDCSTNYKQIQKRRIEGSSGKWNMRVMSPGIMVRGGGNMRKPKLKENGVQTTKCIVQGEVWRQEYKMQTLVYPGSQALDGEATECKLCKHCGCVLNTDYTWLRKSSSSKKINPHADQKQEINFVWPEPPENKTTRTGKRTYIVKSQIWCCYQTLSSTYITSSIMRGKHTQYWKWSSWFWVWGWD